jgi:multimeric flavodoxin WrbA
VTLRSVRVDEADPAELLRCDALILGSPNWSGVTGKLKQWFDESGDLWESGELAGKPAGAFSAGGLRTGVSKQRCCSCSTCWRLTGCCSSGCRGRS